MAFALIAMLHITAFTTTASAQCTMTNKAFPSKEILAYNLYFNWQFVWIPAGTATMSTVETTYRGYSAYRSSLITRTSERVDKVFRMRDTLLVYATKSLVPLYYRKGSHEGDRYYTDEVNYSYPNGKCAVALRHRHNDGSVTKEQHVYDHCVFDMLNIFLRARNYDATNWKKGHTVPMDITGFTELVKAKLIFRGRTTVKADNGVKYKCLELSYVENKDGKEKEIVRFFVTDDTKHVPVRLDLFLRFGSAKAFLSNMK